MEPKVAEVAVAHIADPKSQAVVADNVAADVRHLKLSRISLHMKARRHLSCGVEKHREIHLTLVVHSNFQVWHNLQSRRRCHSGPRFSTCVGRFSMS